jgi:hypothetical protein
MSDRGKAVLAWLVVLVGIAVAILVFDGGNPRAGRAEGFQRAVGGLGFGAALEVSPCAFGFDPRLQRSCDQNTGPIPGGSCFCPRHAGSLVEYPSLPDHD